MDLLTYLRIFIAVHQLKDPNQIAQVLNYYSDVEFSNLEDSLALLEPVEQEDLKEIGNFYEEFADLEEEITNTTLVNLKRKIFLNICRTTISIFFSRLKMVETRGILYHGYQECSRGQIRLLEVVLPPEVLLCLVRVQQHLELREEDRLSMLQEQGAAVTEH